VARSFFGHDRAEGGVRVDADLRSIFACQRRPRTKLEEGNGP